MQQSWMQDIIPQTDNINRKKKYPNQYPFQKKRNQQVFQEKQRPLYLNDKPFSKNNVLKPPTLPALNDINEMIGSVASSTLLEQRQSQMGDLRQDQGLKKWKIGNVISKGTTATVYKALNKYTGVIAAVKKITFLESQQDISKRQLKVLCRINHPYIIKYMQHYEVQNQTWIFMEYVPTTLQKFIKDYGPLPNQLYIKFAKQLIMALQYLYDEKIFHKDIKCSNILVYGKGILKLSDFGCSKGFDQSMSLENYIKGCQTFKGSILWMAPQTLTKNECNRKTDIWGLGCTLLQMATGRAPWSEKKFDNEMAAIWVIANQNQHPLIPENLHENIRFLISSCLKRNPEERLSAKELLESDFFQNI